MSGAKGISQIELERLNRSIHRDQYIPLSEPNTNVPINGESPPKPLFHTIFFKSFTNTIWHSTNKLILDKSNPVASKLDLYGKSVDVDTITYKVPHSIHMLIETTCIMPIPKVWIKKECEGKARIRWGLNLGPSSIYKTVFKNGDDKIDGYSGGWIKTFYNWGYPRSQIECINESIGNIPALTTWSTTSIEAAELRFTMPYFYSYPEDKLMSAFPVFLLGNQCNLTKTLTIPSKLAETLLQIEVTGDGKEWKPLTNPKYFNGIVSVSEHNPPALEVYYGMITDDEKESYYFDNRGNEINRHIYPIHQVIESAAPNITMPGLNAIIPVNCGPLVAVFCNGVNLDAVAEKETSNYTTNSKDPREGVSSIAKVEFHYDKTLRFTLTPSMMKQMETLRHAPGKPQLPGSFLGSFTHNPFKTQGMVGEVPDKAVIDNLVCTYTGVICKKKKEDVEEIFSPSDIIEKALLDQTSLPSQLERHDHSSLTGYWTEVFMLTHANLEFNLKDITDQRNYTLRLF